MVSQNRNESTVHAIIVQYLTSCLRKHGDGSNIQGLGTTADRTPKQADKTEGNFVGDKLDMRWSTGVGSSCSDIVARRLENLGGWINTGVIINGARAIMG